MLYRSAKRSAILCTFSSTHFLSLLRVAAETSVSKLKFQTPGRKFSQERPLEISLLDCQPWKNSVEKAVGKSRSLEDKCDTVCQKRLNFFLPVVGSPVVSIGSTIFEGDRDNVARVVESSQVQCFGSQQDGVKESTSSLTAAINRILANEIGGMSSNQFGGQVKKLCSTGQLMEALHVLDLMDLQGMEPQPETYMDLLQGCISARALSEGKRIHSHIMKSGFESRTLVENALLNMYCKCSSIMDALQLFNNMPEQDLFTWTIIILGCVSNGYNEEALAFLCQMEQEGIKPDAVTLSSALKACANLQALEIGGKIHTCIVKSGYDSDIFLCSTLIDMYAKCGRIEEAQSVLNKMQRKNVYSWSAMITGYVQNGQAEEALTLLSEMVQACVKPTEVTLTSILKACACLGNLDCGKQIHFLVIESAVTPNVLLSSTLVDMYSKCGSLKDACKIFNTIPVRSLVSYNIMIGAYSQHGLAEEALKLFNQMHQEVVKVDEITFVFILSVCSHVGLLEMGYQRFNSMIQEHAITPNEEHYTCMVDLLSRAGRLEETVDFIESMPCQPSTAVWMAFLSACRLCGDGKLGEQAADFVLELESANVSPFMLFSRIYTERQVKLSA